MRRIIAVCLLCLLGMTLTACGGKAEADNKPTNEQTIPTSDAPGDTTDSAGNTRILIAYLSRSGNTEQIAGMIQAQLGGDLFKIEGEQPYPEDYNEILEQAQAEQRQNARPAVVGRVDQMDTYDVVFIGYPIWWGDSPMLIRSFLEAYELSGKTVIPFCTYGSSGAGNSFSSIAQSASGAVVLDGFACAGSGADNMQDQVAAWLDALPITAGENG